MSRGNYRYSREGFNTLVIDGPDFDQVKESLKDELSYNMTLDEFKEQYTYEIKSVFAPRHEFLFDTFGLDVATFDENYENDLSKMEQFEDIESSYYRDVDSETRGNYGISEYAADEHNIEDYYEELESLEARIDKAEGIINAYDKFLDSAITQQWEFHDNDNNRTVRLAVEEISDNTLNLVEAEVANANKYLALAELVVEEGQYDGLSVVVEERDMTYTERHIVSGYGHTDFLAALDVAKEVDRDLANLLVERVQAEVGKGTLVEDVHFIGPLPLKEFRPVKEIEAEVAELVEFRDNILYEGHSVDRELAHVLLSPEWERENKGSRFTKEAVEKAKEVKEILRTKGIKKDLTISKSGKELSDRQQDKVKERGYERGLEL